MFAKIFAAAVLAMTALSASAQLPLSCDVGEFTCCDSFQSPGNYDATAIAEEVGASAQDITGQMGAKCNPSPDTNCNAFLVYCKKNFIEQHIGVNCKPAALDA
ncbi:hypothetical protein BJ165DRAFT_1614001 [Panaeolus papilionaceus]|nr:hypothetical protein BJ165DRAFT_1614001 [Panaeolus papilionaceus]